MPRQTNADIVYAALPEMGSSPVQVQRLAQNLPLTMPQVTAALQVLKHAGRATNPRGARTNYWTRYEEPPVVVEVPEPVEDDPATEAAPLSDAEARVHEVERHLARIEGAHAVMSSRLGEIHDTPVESAEREARLVELVEHLNRELSGPVVISSRAVGSLSAAATRPVSRAV